MVDGKMRSILSGLGGAFCHICTCSRTEAVDIEHSFSIDRSTEEINLIWDKLHSGEMVRKAGDYDLRQGVTQEPIVEWESISSLSPLHCMLRAFDFIMKIIYHLHALSYTWSDKDDHLTQSKREVRNRIKTLTNVAVDVPDSTGKFYKIALLL